MLVARFLVRRLSPVRDCQGLALDLDPSGESIVVDNDAKPDIESSTPPSLVAREIMECIAERLAEPSSTFGEISGLLAQLHERLELRFTAEEASGQYEEAISRAPWLTSDVQSLKQQHAELLQTSQQLLKQTLQANPPPNFRQQIRDDFDDFAARILEHEASEDALLQDIYSPPDWME